MSNEPLPVPEDIKIKIDDWLKPYFPDVSIDVCTGPIDQEKRNEIQRHKRNCLRKGAYFGYSLAASEISLQKAEIERLNAALSEAYAEIKELRRQIDEESPNELDNIF